MLKKPQKLIAATLVGGSVLLVSACGAGRPSEAEVLKAISNPSNVAHIPSSRLAKTQLACLAKTIEESKLSDSALRALVDGKSTFRGSKSDDATLTDMETRLAACLKP